MNSIKNDIHKKHFKLDSNQITSKKTFLSHQKVTLYSFL